MIPSFLVVKSQLPNRFPLERPITEELFKPARHLRGIMDRQSSF